MAVACQARLSVSAGTLDVLLPEFHLFLDLLLQVLDTEPQEEPRKSSSWEERLKAKGTLSATYLFCLNMHMKVLSECRQQHFYEISENQHKANSFVAFKKKKKR